MVAHMVTYVDWLAKYQEVYAAPELVSSMSCPNCAASGLHLVLVVQREGDDHGWAAFWCDRCLTGVAIDRAEIHLGMRLLATGGDPGVVTRTIPNYRLIPPEPTVSAED